jgi:hypothetical protein
MTFFCSGQKIGNKYRLAFKNRWAENGERLAYDRRKWGRLINGEGGWPAWLWK